MSRLNDVKYTRMKKSAAAVSAAAHGSSSAWSCNGIKQSLTTAAAGKVKGTKATSSPSPSSSFSSLGAASRRLLEDKERYENNKEKKEATRNHKGKRSPFVFAAPVRYVRPTPQERRGRLYAYYAAKKLLRDGIGETDANITKMTSPSLASTMLPSLTALCTTMKSANLNDDKDDGEDNNNNNSNNINNDCGQVRSDVSLRDDPAAAERRLLEQLQHLVELYERHYNRKSLEWSKRTFSVPALARLVQSEEEKEKQEEKEKEKERKLEEEGTQTSFIPKAPWGIKVLSPTRKREGGGRRDVDNHSEMRSPTPWGQTVSGYDDLLSSYDLGLPRVLRKEGEGVDESPRDALTLERERRTQSVRQHILNTLKSFDLANRRPKKEEGEMRKEKQKDKSDYWRPPSMTPGFQGFPFEDMTGVCETLLDLPVDATPNVHVRRLLRFLSGEPALQKCAEATARLVTHILMRSLPAELYDGDPEDYRTLRERHRKEADALNMKLQRMTPECEHLSPLSTPFYRPLQQPMSQSPKPQSTTRGGFSETGKSLTLCDDAADTEERYFLHRDSMTLTQALQSVALRKGIWLSSTVQTMQRPPLHGCGLPLRDARDIALGQHRPGNMKNFTLTSKEKFMGKTVSTMMTTTDRSSCKSGVSSTREADDWRPKTLAPLLIIAYGGYGVAPFSTCGGHMPLAKALPEDNGFVTASIQSAAEDENDTVLSAMNNFMRPEPALLPLHPIMQIIYRSVRQNRLLRPDEVTNDFPPAVFDLLMDVVQSYGDFFGSVMRIPFESTANSFFVNSYRETLLSWSSIVICEAAIGYAADRVGMGPFNVQWTKNAMPEKFTEEQLEQIALSGLVEKTFPSMTQLRYDDQLFFRTVDTLRSVVLETIGRVKGELYFFLTGIDRRNAVLEQYRERLQRDRETEAAMRVEAEERLQAQLPGRNASEGGSAAVIDVGAGAGVGDSGFLGTSAYGKGASSPGVGDVLLSLPKVHPFSANCGGGGGGQSLSSGRPNGLPRPCRRPEPPQPLVPSDTGGDTPGNFTVSNPCVMPPSTALPSSPRQLAALSQDNDGDNGEEGNESFPLLRKTVKSAVEVPEGRSLDFQSFAAGTYPSFSSQQGGAPSKQELFPNISGLLNPTVKLSKTPSAPQHQNRHHQQQQRLNKKKSRGSATPCVGTPQVQFNKGPRRPHASDIPENLTVRAVRRELVSLKFQSRRSTCMVENSMRSASGSPVSRAQAKTPASTGLLDDAATAISNKPASSPANVAEGTTMTASMNPPTMSLSPSALGDAAPLKPKPKPNEPTLEDIVGAKQAASVERLRRTCENTAQFYLHFNNALNGDKNSSRRPTAETDWYATGSNGFYERRTVATIKRSRQVVAFDLHDLSPVTALERCVQWPFECHTIDGHDSDEQEWVPRGEKEEHDQEREEWFFSPSLTREERHRRMREYEMFRAKELHLGERMVPWTL